MTFGYEGSFDNILKMSPSRSTPTGSWALLAATTGENHLLNLLLGRYEYTGTITHSVEFEYFPYPVEDREEMTLTILEGIAPEAQLWEIQRELSLLEVEEGVLYRPFSTLSNGEQTKTLLAALFKGEPIPLIDEPTNHLDTLAREKVGSTWRGRRGLSWSPTTGLSWIGVWTMCCPSTGRILKCSGELLLLAAEQGPPGPKGTGGERAAEKGYQAVGAGRPPDRWMVGRGGETKKGTRNAGLRPDRGFIGHKAAKMMKRAKSIEARREDAAQEKAELLHNLEQAGRPQAPLYSLL